MQDISLYDEISINLLNNNMVLIILSIILSTPSLKNIYFKLNIFQQSIGDFRAFSNFITDAYSNCIFSGWII